MALGAAGRSMDPPKSCSFQLPGALVWDHPHRRQQRHQRAEPGGVQEGGEEPAGRAGMSPGWCWQGWDVTWAVPGAGRAGMLMVSVSSAASGERDRHDRHRDQPGDVSPAAIPGLCLQGTGGSLNPKYPQSSLSHFQVVHTCSMEESQSHKRICLGRDF